MSFWSAQNWRKEECDSYLANLFVAFKMSERFPFGPPPLGLLNIPEWFGFPISLDSKRGHYFWWGGEQNGAWFFSGLLLKGLAHFSKTALSTSIQSPTTVVTVYWVSLKLTFVKLVTHSMYANSSRRDSNQGTCKERIVNTTRLTNRLCELLTTIAQI